MKRLDLSAAAPVDGAVHRGGRRSPTCVSPCWRRGSWARTPRPRGRTTRSAIRCRPIRFRSPPFCRNRIRCTRRPVAAGHRYRPLPAQARGAGPVAGGRRRAGLRGAHPVRRGRRADGAGRSRLHHPRSTETRCPSSRPHRPRPGDRSPRVCVTAEALCRGQGAVPRRGWRAAGVFDQHRADRLDHRGAAGQVVSAVGGRPARRPRGDLASPPGRRTVPVLRHPVDRVRHRRPVGTRLLRLRRAATASARTGRRPRGRPTSRRRELTDEEKLADRYGKRR